LLSHVSLRQSALLGKLKKLKTRFTNANMSRPTLTQLEAFFWIVRLGSFQRAAAKLNLAPPTISLRIRQLERLRRALPCSTDRLTRSS